MGRTSEAPQQLIDAARVLIHDRGYNAIGVAEICERADVRKGSFYYFFASKQALAVATLRATWETERQRWVEILSDGTAIESLEVLITEQVQVQQNRQRAMGSTVGCLYGNLALETNQSEEDLRDCLREIFDDQCGLIFDSLGRAAEIGAISAQVATKQRARAIIAQLEGAVLFAKLYDDPTLLDSLWPEIRKLLGTLSK